MKKILLGLVALPVVALAALALWFQLCMPCPGTEKTGAVISQTRIYRDVHGVPHIFAETLRDGYAALGYLHASDRLFQMEMMRRAGTGRLSEILGKDLVNYDKKMRALGIYALVKPYYEGLSDDTKAMMDAYARGVNAYMEHGKLPAEFGLLGFKPQPWNAWDGLIWAKMMAWQLSGNYEDEILREQLLQKGWSIEQVNAIYPAMDKNVPATTKPLEWARSEKKSASLRGGLQADEAIQLPDTHGLLRDINIPRNDVARFYEHLPHTASNAYVISGAHTQSGKPILANDPHLQLQSPILWYLARITLPQGELKGATAPGIPFFPLAQANWGEHSVAWGFTTSNIDAQDITFIDENAKNLTKRHEVFHVKDAADVEMDVEENDKGVVLSGIVQSITDITPPHKKALLQFTGIAKGDKTAQALYTMNIATSAADIEIALKDYSVPPQNLMYADKDHVGYAAVGNVPKRVNDGYLARDNKPWIGVMAQTPKLKDPSAGVIMTANQAIVDDKNCAAFSCAFSRDWSEPYRAMRLENWFNDQFSKDAKLDIDTAKQPMLDITSQATLRFLPILLAKMEIDKLGNNKITDAVVTQMGKWDGKMDRNAPEPLIYHAWLDALMAQMYGDIYTADVTWPRMWAFEHQELSEAAIRVAFDTAMKGLTETYGPDWQHWRWGNAHHAPLKHPLWSHVPVINDMTSLSVETDGDNYTLRRAAPGDFTKPYDDEHGAGYRGIYDLADAAHSEFIIAGGESGHIFAKHYGDLRDTWNAGEFITLTGDEQSLKQSGAASLVLNPALNP